VSCLSLLNIFAHSKLFGFQPQESQ